MLKCKVCLEIKPRSSFYIRKKTDRPYLECKKCNIASVRARQPDRKKYLYDWRSKNPVRTRSNNLKKYWPGSSAEEALANFKQLQLKQNNLCAICHRPEMAKSAKYNHIKELSVDHCTKTGKVRGLLCTQCNTGIGNLKHCTSTLQSAIIYLEENS